MEQLRSQSNATTKNPLKSKWLLFVIIFLFITISFIAGYGAATLMGQKSIADRYIPQQIENNAWENSKSITGTISTISGNTLTITNIVRSISTPPDQKNSDSYQIEITSDTNVLKVNGPIEPGELLAPTIEISANELAVGMIVKVESAEPIISSSIKALSIEAQMGVPAQQTNNDAPEYVPPLTPLDLPTATRSADSETN